MKERILGGIRPKHPFTKTVRQFRSGVALDVGCGDFSTIRLAFDNCEPAFQFKGLEVGADSTVYGRSELPDGIRGNPRFERLVCNVDAEHFPLQDESVDIAFMSHVVEHLHSPIHALKEVHRALRPKGYLYVETPGARSTWISQRSWLQRTTTRSDYKVTLNFYEDPTHVRPYTGRELTAMASACGFTPVRYGVRRAYGPIGVIPAAFALAGGLLFPPQSLLRYHLVSGGYFHLIGWAEYAIMRKP